jgi:3-hydroxyacyl-CoA dehydrogenase
MSFNSVTVVGAGPVGCAIAVAIARVGVPVSIVRGARGEIGLATARIERRLRWHVDGGELRPEERDRARERIKLGTELAVAAGSDLVMETTFGDRRSRRALLDARGAGDRGGRCSRRSSPSSLPARCSRPTPSPSS